MSRRELGRRQRRRQRGGEFAARSAGWVKKNEIGIGNVVYAESRKMARQSEVSALMSPGVDSSRLAWWVQMDREAERGLFFTLGVELGGCCLSPL